MRYVILDTETTGLSPLAGHRLIEIGALELWDRQLTGKRFHTYLNPDREVEFGAQQVHGISTDFLKDKPRFPEVVSALMDFVKGATLIIHNASFDLGFLNHELGLLKHPDKPMENHCAVIDTLLMARNKHRGQKNNLDALCKRYMIDNSNRQYHGALLDAHLLAEVYLAMTRGQDPLLFEEKGMVTDVVLENSSPLSKISLQVIQPTAEELMAHLAYVQKYKLPIEETNS